MISSTRKFYFLIPGFWLYRKNMYLFKCLVQNDYFLPIKIIFWIHFMLTWNTSTDPHSLYFGSCEISIGECITRKTNSGKWEALWPRLKKTFNKELIFRRWVFMRIWNMLLSISHYAYLWPDFLPPLYLYFYHYLNQEYTVLWPQCERIFLEKPLLMGVKRLTLSLDLSPKSLII